MKNNLIYFAFVLLTCIAGMNESVQAQCFVIGVSSITLCNPASTTVTVSTTPTINETWTSTNLSAVTVNFTPGTGVCTVGTAASLGVSTLIYDDPSTGITCSIPVYVGPYAGALTGPANVCENSSTITISSNWPGGTWSSSNTAACTVDAAGVVTGVSAGTSLIYYAVTACGGANTFKPVTVDPVPSPNISGTVTICLPGSTTLTGSPAMGTWTSSNTTVATVAGGNVTAASLGLTTIGYTVSNSCGSYPTSRVVSVLPYAAAISGPTVVCTSGPSIHLSDASPGGTWLITGSAATINSLGVLTGVSGGTVIVNYRVSGCGMATSPPFMVQVDAPYASISGMTPLCNGDPLTLTGWSPNGTWSSTNTAVATIDAFGAVTTLAAGTSTISYTALSSCSPTPFSTGALLVVDGPANAGTITGGSVVCMMATISLTDATGDPGGAWSSDNTSVATVDASGVVTGVTTGTAEISYTISNSCGNYPATHIVTVQPAPNSGSIYGATAICNGTSTLLTDDGDPGGAWTSSNTAIATVGSSTGVVNATTTPGNVTIVYTIANGYGCTRYSNFFMTIDPSIPDPGTINTLGSTHTVCYPEPRVIFSDVYGGVWTSSNTAVVTLSTDVTETEYVNAQMARGTATITYTVTNTCSSDYRTFSVNLLPAELDAIAGNDHICSGGTTTLSNTDGGGVWSSTNTTVATVDSSSGVVTALRHGTSYISYKITNVCMSPDVYIEAVIDTLPDIISATGSFSMCTPVTGYTPDYYLHVSSTQKGGTWTSSNTAVAVVYDEGPTYGADLNSLSTGTATITYSVTTAGCGAHTATTVLTVEPAATFALYVPLL